MSSHNVDLVRTIYGHFGAKDVQRALLLMDPQIEWVVPHETSPEPHTFRGRSGVEKDATRWREAWNADLTVDVEELIDAGDEVVAVVRWRGSGAISGVEVDMPLAAVWTLARGLVVRFEHYPNRGAALEAVGLTGWRLRLARAQGRVHLTAS